MPTGKVYWFQIRNMFKYVWPPVPLGVRRQLLSVECNCRNLLLTVVVRCIYNARGMMSKLNESPAASLCHGDILDTVNITELSLEVCGLGWAWRGNSPSKTGRAGPGQKSSPM